MKNIRKIISLLIILVVTMIGINKIDAEEPTTITSVKSGERIYFNGTATAYGNSSLSGSELYPTIFFKTDTTDQPYLCVSGYNVPAKATTCTIDTELYAGNRIAIAYLLNQIIGNETPDINNAEYARKYYLAEAAVLLYGNKFNYTGVATANNDQARNDALLALLDPTNSSSTFRIVNDGVIAGNYNALATEAADYQSMYSSPISIGFKETNISGAEISEIVFTENKNDGYFYSQIIYVETSGFAKNFDDLTIALSGVDSNKFEIVNKNVSNQTFQVRVAKSSVLGKKLSASVTVEGINVFYTSVWYNCGSDAQGLVSTKPKRVEKSGSKSISGSIELTKVEISKTDGKNFLKGAKIKIINEDRNCTGDLCEIEFTSSGGLDTFEGLPYGTYSVKEVLTPSGYITSATSQFTLKESKLSALVEIVNLPTEVEVKKTDFTTGDLIKGAKLEIQDEDGNVVKNAAGEEYKWESTEEVHIIKGLPGGKYYLVETLAPKGYELNEERIEFTITTTPRPSSTDSIVRIEMKNALEVDVPNTLSSKSALLMTIAMFDVALGIGILVYVKKNKIEE